MEDDGKIQKGLTRKSGNHKYILCEADCVGYCLSRDHQGGGIGGLGGVRLGLPVCTARESEESVGTHLLER